MGVLRFLAAGLQHSRLTYCAQADCDYKFKYRKTSDGWDQLDVALVGTCVSPGIVQHEATARSGGLNNLRGITQDGAKMYKYFYDNGANVSVYIFAIPPRPAEEVMSAIEQFLKRPGNNKFLFLTGHGNKKGDLVLDEGVHLTARQVFMWLSEANFHGHITILVDACYAGQWAKTFHSLCKEKSPLVKTLTKCTRGKTFINFRLSSLASECSRDSAEGGMYTLAILNSLRREHSLTKELGHGWGTKVLVQRPPDQNTVVWGIKKTEPQTDIAADFVICDDGTVKLHRPSDRAKYIY